MGCFAICVYDDIKKALIQALKLLKTTQSDGYIISTLELNDEATVNNGIPNIDKFTLRLDEADENTIDILINTTKSEVIDLENVKKIIDECGYMVTFIEHFIGETLCRIRKV